MNPLLPKGTTLVITAGHDNTDQNPNNPDYRQWVGWGDRTVDERAEGGRTYEAPAGRFNRYAAAPRRSVSGSMTMA